MNTSEESVHRPLARPFLYMLAFYLVLDAVSGWGAFFVASLPMLSPFKPLLIATLLMFGIKIVIGLLFILWMGGSPRNHGFTLKSPDLSIRPAIILGAGMAAAYFAQNLPSMLSHPEMHPAGPLKIDTMILTGLSYAVNAFILCGVMQEFISRRADGHIRILRWKIPLAVIAVSLIAFLYPVIQMFIVILWNGLSTVMQSGGLAFAGSYFSKALLFGAMALVYSYLYDRSRSLAAPVIAGSLSGILSGLFYYLAVYSPFLNHMR